MPRRDCYYSSAFLSSFLEGSHLGFLVRISFELPPLGRGSDPLDSSELPYSWADSRSLLLRLYPPKAARRLLLGNGHPCRPCSGSWCQSQMRGHWRDNCLWLIKETQCLCRSWSSVASPPALRSAHRSYASHQQCARLACCSVLSIQWSPFRSRNRHESRRA